MNAELERLLSLRKYIKNNSKPFDIGRNKTYNNYIKTINNQRQNEMSTTLKLAIETYSELTGMSFDDIKNEMMNNECGDVYRRVVLLMLSVA